VVGRRRWRPMAREERVRSGGRDALLDRVRQLFLVLVAVVLLVELIEVADARTPWWPHRTVALVAVAATAWWAVTLTRRGRPDLLLEFIPSAAVLAAGVGLGRHGAILALLIGVSQHRALYGTRRSVVVSTGVLLGSYLGVGVVLGGPSALLDLGNLVVGIGIRGSPPVRSDAAAVGHRRGLRSRAGRERDPLPAARRTEPGRDLPARARSRAGLPLPQPRRRGVGGSRRRALRDDPTIAPGPRPPRRPGPRPRRPRDDGGPARSRPGPAPARRRHDRVGGGGRSGRRGTRRRPHCWSRASSATSPATVRTSRRCTARWRRSRPPRSSSASSTG
jgi:hypothetical protein